MIRGFWSARTGLIAHQGRMDTIANNLANVNTVGFKPMRSSFKDLIYQNMNRPAAEDTAMTGAGIKINTNDQLMKQGPLQESGRGLDLALLGDGEFFAVENENGELFYTRAGNFYIQLDGDEPYLVDGSGNRVLDADGEQIVLEYDRDGRQIFDPAEVGVYRFPNAYGLTPAGSNLFMQSENSGEPESVEDPQFKAGYLEGSGVDIAQEMAGVIEASKAFALSARVSQMADEIEQTVNNLR